MKENKIVFIICANDELYLNECIFYINHLTIPEGYETDIMSIMEASGISEAYNAAMRESDAKYKVYLHQDVFILNKNLIADVLKIFEDKTIGMIGVLGRSGYCEDARFYVSWDTGMTLGCNVDMCGYCFNKTDKIDKVEDVAAVDGMLMITQYDIEWKKEILGWNFYDISQSIEFGKQGYRVVVPHQEATWALHDAGWCSMEHYDKDREAFCRIYKECGFVYRKEDDNKYTAIQERYREEKNAFIQCINDGKLTEAAEYAEKLNDLYEGNTDVSLFKILYEVYGKDLEKRGHSGVFKQNDWKMEKSIYHYVKFLVWHIEYGFEPSEYMELFNMLLKKVISVDYIQAVVAHSVIDSKRVWEEISCRFSEEFS
jgi:hypothetical protein